jgi:hypothetical protein
VRPMPTPRRIIWPVISRWMAEVELVAGDSR